MFLSQPVNFDVAQTRDDFHGLEMQSGARRFRELRLTVDDVRQFCEFSADTINTSAGDRTTGRELQNVMQRCHRGFGRGTQDDARQFQHTVDELRHCGKTQ